MLPPIHHVQCCCCYILLSLCVNVVYVFVIICNVVASKYHQCCDTLLQKGTDFHCLIFTPRSWGLLWSSTETSTGRGGISCHNWYHWGWWIHWSRGSQRSQAGGCPFYNVTIGMRLIDEQSLMDCMISKV